MAEKKLEDSTSLILATLGVSPGKAVVAEPTHAPEAPADAPQCDMAAVLAHCLRPKSQHDEKLGA